MTYERRTIASDVEVRALEGQDPKIEGLAARYYDGTQATEYELWPGGPRERIMPGAFSRAMQEDDVRALFNHDPNLLLGRTSSGTLRLADDALGLRFEIDPPDTQAGRDTVSSIKRRDVQGCSFSFVVTDEEWKREDGNQIREVQGVRLYDVGPVTFPAYESTTVSARCRATAVELEDRDEIERQADEADALRIELEDRERRLCVISLDQA